ncbi:restriction endonuclease subunit S [Azotobacter beijerinckii]|uniref:restriction endonuclease subunit S n=1 Tax=Azotobacter beijerinckii TaxID=170623 RepID=UPI002954F5C5|nr:restriction endonuclease subunit S [Azotobacter beijerinckii]MDV7212413.1 hypothetical protein [Azotobacter beijerinckii]
MSQFKPYPAYKDSGVEWLGEVPENWTVCKLNFRYSVELGKMLDEKRITNTSPLPYLRNQDVQWGKINTDDLPEMDIHPVEMERYTIRSGDLLVCEGGDVGRAAIWRSEDSALGYQKALHRLRHRYAHVDTAEFFYFVLLAAKLRGVFEESESKSTIAHLPAEKFRQYRFVFPPLPDQLTIAAYLNHETARIDALIEEQQRLIELLKEKRQAVISHAVTKGLDPTVPMKDSGVEWLGDVPSHWKIKRLKQLVIDAAGIQMGPFGGMLIDLEDSDTGYKVYGQENTISGNFSSGGRWISESRYLALSSYHLEVGDIVLTRKGSLGNCRRVSMLPQAGIIDSDTIRIRVQDRAINPEYLERTLHEAGYISTQLSLVKRGAILSGLNTEIIANLVIIAPPLEEQEELLQEINKASSKFDQGISDCEYAVELLQERRSALISAAVTGKIDLRGWQPPANTPAPLREQETA